MARDVENPPYYFRHIEFCCEEIKWDEDEHKIDYVWKVGFPLLSSFFCCCCAVHHEINPDHSFLLKGDLWVFSALVFFCYAFVRWKTNLVFLTHSGPLLNRAHETSNFFLFFSLQPVKWVTNEDTMSIQHKSTELELAEEKKLQTLRGFSSWKKKENECEFTFSSSLDNWANKSEQQHNEHTWNFLKIVLDCISIIQNAIVARPIELSSWIWPGKREVEFKTQFNLFWRLTPNKFQISYAKAFCSCLAKAIPASSWSFRRKAPNRKCILCALFMKPLSRQTAAFI